MRVLRAVLAFIAVGAGAACVLLLALGAPGVELGTLWHQAGPESLNLTQAVTQRYIHPSLWTHVLLPVLLTPAWIFFAVMAAVSLLLWLVLLRRRASER